MTSAPRDMDATWRTASAALEERGWPWLRLLGELVAKRLSYRTHPPCEIDWGDPTLRFDRAESTVTILDRHPAKPGVRGFYKTVAVEILLPTDASPAPAPPVATSSSSSPPTSPRRNVSEAELRQCLLAIVRDHPNDPLGDDTLHEEVETRLGAPVGRNRVSSARKDHAPQWVNPVGRPPKSRAQ